MNSLQQNILLQRAKASVAASVAGAAFSETTTDDNELLAKCGCFVTLKNNDDLRGCIGQFTSDKPLINLITEMAGASSTRDSRFFANPITADELEQLEIEISVLSPLRKTDNPLSLRLGRDGIYIINGHNSGCFLPQVATETGWDAEQFLSYCCSHKAGLAPDAWKDRQTEVYLFDATVFSAKWTEIE
ncbi:MAG: AmmeMemoRadiSam system protein A [Anaerohalosphaera sp.]|nr:AmmeMemoRadiSam system protein A [Anaerohalosphaera sp.]